MKVLVTGASGFLGQYIVRELVARGHCVRAVIRPAAAALTGAGQVEIFRADLRNHDNLARAFEGVDALLHAAAATSGNEDEQFTSTVVATERLLDAMVITSVKRILLVSSLVVYDWSKANGLMDESTPLLSDIYNRDAYTIAKIWQERVTQNYARKHGLQLTIMRPGFIWGPERLMIAGMGRRVGKLYVMLGPFSRLPLTHCFNCASCLVSAFESSAAVGRAINVVDSDDIRVWRYVKAVKRRSGKRGMLLPIPYRLGLLNAQLAALTSWTLWGRNGCLPSLLTPRKYEAQFKPIRFSNRQAQEILNWKPPLSFDDCLEFGTNGLASERNEYSASARP